MLLENLREEVLSANLELVRSGLVQLTFGNASGIDREKGLIAIKPSGVPYAEMRSVDIVITDLEGSIVDGDLKPSSDLHTHLALYKGFPEVGGVVHTHSTYATAWAQSGRSIPALGTTHADYFYGAIPNIPPLSDEEIDSNYVLNTGLAICRRFESLDPMATPAALIAGHAPFCWGRSVTAAARIAAVLETVAFLALCTNALQPDCPGVSQALLNQHHFRKHGPNATYGQK